MRTIRIDERFQGPTGRGQGGWTASQLVAVCGQPATVAIRQPIPIDTDLEVVENDDHWSLVDRRADTPVTILDAKRWVPDFPSTPALSPDVAALARRRFPVEPDDHPVPLCFSCGLEPDSMRVHAGPVGDGRFATDWVVPAWAVDAHGSVDEGVIWAAVDCAAAWYACYEGGARSAFTAQLAVEVLEPLTVDARYAVVSWQGDWPGGWDGRKRGAASAVFDEDGTCVARSRSFWIAVG